MKNVKKFLYSLPGANYAWNKREQVILHKIEQENRIKYEFDSKGDQPFVSIIICNPGDIEYLRILMTSLKKSQFYDRFEIIFLNSNAGNDTVEYMKKWENDFTIKLIDTENKQSSSAMRRIGAEHAEGDYLLFLNGKTKVTHRWLDALLMGVQGKQDCGVIGARVLYPEMGRRESTKRKSFKVQHMGVAFKEQKRQKQFFYGPYRLADGKRVNQSACGLTECAAVTSSVFMVTRTAYEAVGGFDENYLRLYEDVDLSLRLAKAGYHNYVCQNCIVYSYDLEVPDAHLEEAEQKEILHDVKVFKGKWHRYLSRIILNEKIEGKNLYSGGKLTVTIATTKNKQWMDNYPCIKMLADVLQKNGYVVQFINSEKKDGAYNIGIGTDVLISVDPEYDITQIKNIKNDLVKVNLILDEENKRKQLDCDERFQYTLSCGQKDTEEKEWKEAVDDLIRFLMEYNKDQVDEKEIDIFGAMPDTEAKKFWGDWHYAKAVKKEMEKRGYKANIITREHMYDRSKAKYTLVLRGVLEYYPSEEENRKVIMWNISHPADVTIPEYNLFDYVFFASERMKREIGPKIYPSSGVLMQCTDPSIMTSDENRDKKYELLFVGNSRRVYRQILKDLLPTEFQLSVFGRHWEEYPVQEYVVNDYIDNNEVAQAYHDAKILLNDHWDDMIQYGIISNRIFDALSAGAFVISDYMPEIEELFEGAVVTYQGKEDLNQKITYYLQHEEVRDEKATHGKEIVRNGHTFANRVEKIVNVMRSL